MKEVRKITLTLTSVCIICAFFLSLVYGLANKKIEDNAQKKITDAISNIAPEAKIIKEIKKEGGLIYQLYNSNDNLIGYAFLAEGQGYQGKIKILVVIDNSLNQLTGIEIVESVETPGLGSRIQENSFLKQFVGLDVSNKIADIKNEDAAMITKNNKIEIITGATISSKAVMNILNKRITEIKELLK